MAFESWFFLAWLLFMAIRQNWGLIFLDSVFYLASGKVKVAEKSRKIAKLSLENEKNKKRTVLSFFSDFAMKNDRAKFRFFISNITLCKGPKPKSWNLPPVAGTSSYVPVPRDDRGLRQQHQSLSLRLWSLIVSRVWPAAAPQQLFSCRLQQCPWLCRSSCIGSCCKPQQRQRQFWQHYVTTPYHQWYVAAAVTSFQCRTGFTLSTLNRSRCALQIIDSSIQALLRWTIVNRTKYCH